MKFTMETFRYRLTKGCAGKWPLNECHRCRHGLNTHRTPSTRLCVSTAAYVYCIISVASIETDKNKEMELVRTDTAKK